MSDQFSASPLQPGPLPPQKLTFTVWLILVIASIGFAFDIYELLMLPLIMPTALSELLPGVEAGSDTFNFWRAMMFWVPAMAGGGFGLYGGYLTDLLGRRRVLTWSILLYAISAFLAGFSTSMPMLLFFRSTTFIGVCVEFVAAVAWLAELFPNHEQRERVLGYTQAFSSVGGLMVTGAFLLANRYSASFPAINLPEFLGFLGKIEGTHAPWRYTLMSGLVPALPLIIIRPFLPESPIWQQKKDAGTLSRPSFTELFQGSYLNTTVITTVLVACSFGAAFGAIQQMPQIVPVMDEYKEKKQELMTERYEKIHKKMLSEKKEDLDALVDADERRAAEKKIAKRAEITVGNITKNEIAGHYTLSQEVGGLFGRFLLALLVVRIASRRNLLRVFLVPGLVLMPFTFAYIALHNQTLFSVAGYPISLLHIGMFLAGVLTVGQFSFWGNYLPTVYPTHLRGTGESVAHNIGGRMAGTSFAALASILSGFIPVTGATPIETDALRMAYAAGTIGFLVYFVGLLLSWKLPEPKEETIRE